jgi:BirA family biotin operon repressor/biotin-[acetyl-CoA-carboxylase] ligase
LEIFWFDTLDSTQNTLIESVKSKRCTPPVCIAAERQTKGIGSRGNSWDSTENALLFSFALKKESLPSDLKIESASIYFMYILKELLKDGGSQCWFKWPNDIYIGNKKIAGTITYFDRQNETLICGIGINLCDSGAYGKCDVKLDKKNLLSLYLATVKKMIPWGDVFRKFEVEFFKTKGFEGYEKSIIYNQEVTLNDDGSISLNNQKVFSLR